MKKIVKYGSPRQYQPGWEKTSRVPGIRKYICKRLKGNHKYGSYKNWFFSKKPSGLWERKCEGCGHKDLWMAPTLPGIYYERDLKARPPGAYEEYNQKTTIV